MLKKLTIENILNKSNQIRKDLVNVAVINKAGHIAPSLSSVDILVSLYYGIMNIAKDSQWEERDRLVFSKAHGCYGLYAVLADIGYLERKDWEGFYNGSSLAGCVERNIKNGLEVGCGSLGHGLPMAVGIAFGAMQQDKKYRVYCIVGDGEMQEGSNWEAIQFAVKYKLSNLTLIIDHNKLQAMDFLENVLTLKDKDDDLQIKMEAFGFSVERCDGHNSEHIMHIIKRWIECKHEIERPQVLIAYTIKGYGLKCMENIPKFHFRVPNDIELEMGNRYE